ncbi:MAG: RNA polymerase sigma factor [Pseudomonadota bacterium]
MPDRSDDELMRLAGAGDRAAFAGLVERYLKRAASLAGRIAGNRSDAEEIVQEAFLRTWLKAPDWRAGAGFPTWFHRVLVNLCLDRKRRPALAPLEAAGEVADPGPNGFAHAARDETARRVAAAMAALPERQRLALVFCHYQGMSNVDAASILDISVGALESLLVRARRTLREALADLVDTTP